MRKANLEKIKELNQTQMKIGSNGRRCNCSWKSDVHLPEGKIPYIKQTEHETNCKI